MPLTDTQWDELLAQVDRAGKKPEPPKADPVRQASNGFLDNLIRRFKRQK